MKYKYDARYHARRRIKKWVRSHAWILAAGGGAWVALLATGFFDATDPAASRSAVQPVDDLANTPAAAFVAPAPAGEAVPPADNDPGGATPAGDELGGTTPVVGNELGVAVIVGNRTYADERVPEVAYAHSDAEAFKRFVTGRLGFDADNVIDLRDATKSKLEEAFGVRGNARGRLWRRVDPSGGSDVVVFYSGHGVPGRAGRGYLLPADSNPDTAELNGYPIDLLYENLGGLPSRSATVYLDACFSGNSPGGMLIRSASPVYVEADLSGAAPGLTVLTAASGAQLASWDDKAGHGLFTEHLLDGLYGAADADGDGRVTAREAKRHLNRTMTRAAQREFGREQDAGLYGDGGAVLSVAPTGGWRSRPALPPAAFKVMVEPAGARVRILNAGSPYRAGMELAAGSYEVEASAEGYETMRETVAHGAAPTVRRIALRRADSKAGDHFRDCPECPEMVVVPAGSYRMGRQRRQHDVTIAAPFAVGKYEVTFAEWDACVREGGCPQGKGIAKDRGWGRDRRPVIHVNWNDAKRYVQWLSQKAKKAYRLPSESEWEYAARAGTETAYSWGNKIGVNRANCAGCGGQWDKNNRTAPVGSFAANAWGLHDMHGNVWERVEDCWNRSYTGAPSDGSAWLSGSCAKRVSRGGAWNGRPSSLRSANRVKNTVGSRVKNVGFRVARAVAP